MQMENHYPTCPASSDAEADCRCNEIEDAQVAEASRPSAAEMIRRAKAAGILKPAVTYT